MYKNIVLLWFICIFSLSALRGNREYKSEKLFSILDFRENSIKGPQYIDEASYRLSVEGLVEKPMIYTYSEVLENNLNTKKITMHCVEGWSVDILWEGIKLEDLISKSEVLPSANTVIFHSRDGYTTSLPLSTILEKELLLAYKMNGLVLPPERGFPFQVVAEDKLGYKWAKWVEKIELSDDPEYEGFCESRGYSNEADVKIK